MAGVGGRMLHGADGLSLGPPWESRRTGLGNAMGRMEKEKRSSDKGPIRHARNLKLGFDSRLLIGIRRQRSCRKCLVSTPHR